MNSMTWKRTLQIGSAVGMLAVLALASGADWVDGFASFFGGW
ncbi:MAG: hypothetical protein ACRENM_00185 [Candidatus Dormibacteraceae bacterium]|nr:hypothetical protein [Candidatus Acidoferrales bacterium]